MAEIDYSVYLVTGRDLLPPGKDYYESLEESLKGGVTVVQIREKNLDTTGLIEIAARSKEICDRYNVPLLINDRVDVAISVNARGVHLGQTDTSVKEARSLLPEGTIIGVSCNTVDHVKVAVKDGADYIGIGAIWNTQTKQLTSPPVGVRGVGAMLEILDHTQIKAVAIGGIKSTNLLRTLHGSVSPTDHPLDGVAIVSEIVASSTPCEAAKKLATIIKSFHDTRANVLQVKSTNLLHINHALDASEIVTSPTTKKYAILDRVRVMWSKTLRSTPDRQGTPKNVQTDVGGIIQNVIQTMNTVRGTNPLVHQITNTVVATQSANITLALGGSPIMASEPQEMEDMCRISSGLLINIGTMRSDGRESMSIAGHFANENKTPVVFDPVGVGASTFRKETVNELLNTFQASVIKGNAGELAVLADSQEVLTKGVDSVGPGFKNPIRFVKSLARKERCVVVMTGPVDYISDGNVVIALSNGHKMLSQITGSGCIVGSSIATYCGALSLQSKKTIKEENNGELVHGDMLLGAVAGVLVLTIGAELAAERVDVKGPGTFLPALIDELWSLSPEAVRSRARVQYIQDGDDLANPHHHHI